MRELEFVLLLQGVDLKIGNAALLAQIVARLLAALVAERDLRRERIAAGCGRAAVVGFLSHATPARVRTFRTARGRARRRWRTASPRHPCRRTTGAPRPISDAGGPSGARIAQPARIWRWRGRSGRAQ